MTLYLVLTFYDRSTERYLLAWLSSTRRMFCTVLRILDKQEYILQKTKMVAIIDLVLQCSSSGEAALEQALTKTSITMIRHETHR